MPNWIFSTFRVEGDEPIIIDLACRLAAASTEDVIQTSAFVGGILNNLTVDATGLGQRPATSTDNLQPLEQEQFILRELPNYVPWCTDGVLVAQDSPMRRNRNVLHFSGESAWSPPQSLIRGLCMIYPSLQFLIHVSDYDGNYELLVAQGSEYHELEAASGNTYTASSFGSETTEY